MQTAPLRPACLFLRIVSVAAVITIPNRTDSIGNPGTPAGGGGEGVEIMEADFMVMVIEPSTMMP